MKFLVTEAQIHKAMAYYEAAAGPRDGITICKEVSRLADLLGVMWFQKETVAEIPASSTVYTLLQGAGQELQPLPKGGVD